MLYHTINSTVLKKKVSCHSTVLPLEGGVCSVANGQRQAISLCMNWQLFSTNDYILVVIIQRRDCFSVLRIIQASREGLMGLILHESSGGHLVS